MYTISSENIIRIKKSPFSQLRKIKARSTLLQPATENSKKATKKQRTKDQETKPNKNKIKHQSSTNNMPVSHLFRDHQQYHV
jgi:hypothetical protein